MRPESHEENDDFITDFHKVLLTDWLTDWLTYRTDYRDAIASKKVTSEISTSKINLNFVFSNSAVNVL